MTNTPQIPHAPMHEKSVLSILAQYPDALDDVGHLTDDHFWLYPAWFRLIREMIATGQHTANGIDHVGLFHAAQKLEGGVERIGGPSMLSEIIGYAVSGPSPLAKHCAVLSEFRARRMALRAADGITEAAMTGEAGELADAASNPVTAILDAMTDSSPPQTLREIMRESIARFELRATGAEDSVGIQTHPLLDAHLRGAHPGRLWVIGAYPEGGKSVLASQIILDAALAGHPGLLLSLEMAERDLMDRMIVQAARIDARAFTEPRAYAAENGGETINAGLMHAISRVVPTIAKCPIRLQRPANRNIATVISAIRKAKREMGIQIAAVDYLQLVKGGKHDTREGEISEVSHALQECAQDLGITLLVLTQLNADGDTKHGRVIEEDADAVINIIQDRNKDSETYKAHRHIVIAKDRHYGTGGTRVRLILDRARIRFLEGDDQSAQDVKKPRFAR